MADSRRRDRFVQSARHHERAEPRRAVAGVDGGRDFGRQGLVEVDHRGADGAVGEAGGQGMPLGGRDAGDDLLVQGVVEPGGSAEPRVGAPEGR